MNQHRFWKGINPLNLDCEDLSETIVKLCALHSDYIILTSNQNLYYCKIEKEKLILRKIIGVQAIDISYHNDLLYTIDGHGRLYKSKTNFQDKEEIIVKEESKHCSHGFKTSASKVKFRSVATNDFGQLFISTDGQLWGSGVMPQICLDTNDITKIPFFEGKTVYSASVGHNFAAVIVRKKIDQSENCDTDSDNEDEEVFASNCSQCQNIIRLASPASVPSISDTCPLGIQINNSSDESSSTTAPQTDVHVDGQSLTEDSSPSSDESKIIKPALVHTNNSDIDTNSENRITNGIVTEKDKESEDSDTNTDRDSKVCSERINNIFMNSDSARQFLSKQLQWVSVGEDYLVEYTEKPTRIIKENVSNLTNFVYEGVKTVGDKVATLSRHVSGSSDNNETVELETRITAEEISSLMCKYTSTLNLDEYSTSTASSDKNLDNHKSEHSVNIIKLGKNVLATELWTWGEIKYGQLGIEYTSASVKPTLLISLSGLGLQKVSCGEHHCAVLSLDGRLFMWGHNFYHQVSFENKQNKSFPKQFTENSNSDRIRDAVATRNHTVVYTHNGNIFYFGKYLDGYTESIINLNEQDVKDPSKINNETTQTYDVPQSIHCKNKFQNTCHHTRILSCKDITYCSVEKSAPEFQDLSIAQRYLEEMLLIYHKLIKPFVKKFKAVTEHANIYEKVCDSFADLVNVTALNVLSMWQYVEKHISESDISLIKYLDEYIYLYRKYYIAICYLIVIGGFSQINNIIDIPSSVYDLFSDQLPTNKQKNNKKTSEAIVALALVQPLTRLSSYRCIAQSLIRHQARKMKENSTSHIDEKLNKALSSIDLMMDEQEKKRKEAEATKLFWETSGKVLEQYRAPERLLIRESKTKPLNLINSGRFATHKFILFNDFFLHISGSTQNVHKLELLWVEALPNSDSLQNVIQLTTPEEVISVSTNSEQEKTEWIHAFNSSICIILRKPLNFKPPATRTASYTFTNKSQFYKDGKYHGRWLDGKIHGIGKIEWPDNRVYVGQFQNNTLCGYGKMNIPGVGAYEGQWKDNLQNGYGVMKYSSGDVYEGYFKDGLPHGHGVKRQGDFTSSTATIYIGEWANGVKYGYGLMNDIGKGEKYLGNWSDNKKHGCGLIVTLDGIYYEGLFMQDVLTGHGVMVFEDGTHYEGEFRQAGVFSGKGVLTFASGDKIEGNLNGAWTEGVKIANATMYLNVSNSVPASPKPNSFGKLCVAPNQKWNALYRQCFQCLGVPDNMLSPTGSHCWNTTNLIDNKKIWQNVAIAISTSHKDKHKNTPKYKNSELEKSIDCLEVIPQFGQTNLTLESLKDLKVYLQNACDSANHPLGPLILGLTNAFNATYGGVRVHPLLLSHAVKELKCMTSRLYHVVRLLFPALPPEGADLVLPYDNSDDIVKDTVFNESTTHIQGEVVSPATLIQPLILPRIQPALFVLYALHNKQEDDLYWKRLLKWNRNTDQALLTLLGVDQKFWAAFKNGKNEHSQNEEKEHMFREAAETLQQLKTTFSPTEKLLVIKNTFQKMTTTVQLELGSNYLWSMDELFPVFHFVVIRARVLQLGSEVHFIEDFIEPGVQNGELGLMFTTLKACYFQILQEKLPIN